MEKGKCGDYSGQYIGQDASTVLNTKTVNALKPNPFTITQWFYYTNIEIDQMIGENTPTPVGSTYPFYLYFDHETGNSNPNTDYGCLSPDEMNWYYNSAIDLIQNNTGPVGKHYVSHIVFDHWNNYNVYFHWCERRHVINISYGTRKYSFDIDRRDDFRRENP